MTKQSIADIKALLAKIEDPLDPVITTLSADSRKGVQTALKQWHHRKKKQQELSERYLRMSQFEEKFYEQGFRFIAGIDEVGRGPLAGPVVAAAVILPKNARILGLNDSKQLSHAKREELFDEIQEQAVSIGIGVVEPEIIDQINIYEATKVAMKKAVQDLNWKPDALLIDAMKLDLALPQENLIKGDARSNSIAAASIIAKVTRDQLMVDYAQQYPHYGFEHNAGYGTKEHLEAVAQYGVLPIHRRSFAPIKDYF